MFSKPLRNDALQWLSIVTIQQPQLSKQIGHYYPTLTVLISDDNETPTS